MVERAALVGAIDWTRLPQRLPSGSPMVERAALVGAIDWTRLPGSRLVEKAAVVRVVVGQVPAI